MTRTTRRHFLQFTGSALAGIGINQLLFQRQAPYFINSPNSIAQAVVTRVSGDTAQLWLGGVDLRKVKAGTVFTAMKGTGQVRVVSRDGMVAQATVEKAVMEGMPLGLMGNG